jgi:ferrous iron transport protein A
MSDTRRQTDAAQQAGEADMPLSRSAIGQDVVLTRIVGGRGLVRRLFEMGLRPGSRVIVLNRQPHGPVIVTLGRSRLVLGRGMVDRVFVRPSNCND